MVLSYCSVVVVLLHCLYVVVVFLLCCCFIVDVLYCSSCIDLIREYLMDASAPVENFLNWRLIFHTLNNQKGATI